MTLVKGYLIDPFACTITEVEHEADSIEGIYMLLTNPMQKVTCFTVAYSRGLSPGDAIFVDDEGLLTPCDRFFMIAGNPQPLAGKGLVLGSNANGDTVAVKTSKAKVEDMVVFLEIKSLPYPVDRAGLAPTVEPWKPREAA